MITFKFKLDIPGTNSDGHKFLTVSYNELNTKQTGEFVAIIKNNIVFYKNKPNLLVDWYGLDTALRSYCAAIEGNEGSFHSFDELIRTR